jgi:tRNA threonylcarbamoyladenosine biosynthesis protein TsaB
MRILAIDTALGACAAAVLDSQRGAILASESIGMVRGHAEAVMPLIARVMDAARCEFADLDRIAVTVGPGSFTGLRVGLAVVKGLALPFGVPIYVVSSLQALAVDLIEAHDGGAVTAVPCLDAGKGEIYVGGYVPDGAALVRETGPECRIAAGALADWLAALPAPPPAVAGNGADRHAVAGRLAVPGPSALSVCRLALLQRARGEAANLATAVPSYGRPPDITVKKVRGGPPGA